MKKELFTTIRIALYGIGIALFVVLGIVAPIPIPNTTAHIDLGYVVMAVFAYLYGGIPGLIVGAGGRFVEDMILFGSLGSPGWLIASACMGFFLGEAFQFNKKRSDKKVAFALNVSATVVINAVFLIGLSPAISSLWHGVPYVAKVPSGISAFITDSIAVIALGLPIGMLLEKKKLYL